MTKSTEQKFNELLEKYGLQHLTNAESTTLKSLRQDLELFFLQGMVFGMTDATDKLNDLHFNRQYYI